MAGGRPPSFNSFTCPNCGALYQVVKVERGPETNNLNLTCRSCGGSLPSREGIRFEVFHVAQGDSNLATSVILAVLSGHFHMIPLGWRGASPNSLRAACAVADGMDSLGDRLEIPQGLLAPAYLAIALAKDISVK
jgi:hypothetical protein